MSSLLAAIRGQPQSLAHRYQMAKSLVTQKHHAECRKLFNGRFSPALWSLLLLRRGYILFRCAWISLFGRWRRRRPKDSTKETCQLEFLHFLSSLIFRSIKRNEVTWAKRENSPLYCQKGLPRKHWSPIFKLTKLFRRAPAEDELPTPTTSGQLRNFERAVNGDDIYKESSDEQSLGEEEASLDLFAQKPKANLALPKIPSPRTVCRCQLFKEF